MQISNSLKKVLEKESANLQINKLKNNAINISENYRSNNKKSISSKEDVLAYALSRMPATYCAVYSSLQQTLNQIKILPKSLLDVGAGTGSATFAAHELLTLERINCLEYQDEMIKMGKKLISYDIELNNKTTWKKFNFILDNIENKYDMVISSYVLNELTEEEQLKAVEKLWNATNNLLLIVDAGTPKNFQQMQKIRSYLLSQNANLIAPCTHSNNCPIKQNDWCHFTTRVERSKIHKILKQGESPFEDEKFTYLAFSKIENNHANSRVLRHPIYKPKVVDLELCTKNGEKKTVKITKSNENYKLARKVGTGDEFV